MRDAFEVEHLETGDVIVKAKADLKDAHIAKLVAKQGSKAVSW